MTESVPDTRRLTPESAPSTTPAVQSAAETLYERFGGCCGIAGAVDVLFLNVKVNANVREHHGNPANGAGYKFLVTGWSIEAAGARKVPSATT